MAEEPVIVKRFDAPLDPSNESDRHLIIELPFVLHLLDEGLVEVA